MGKKNNPNRDNSVGKEERLQKNNTLNCIVPNCHNNRYGYSQYCIKHKNHIAKTGDINQSYITQLKTKLKPYVEEMITYIESHRDNDIIQKGLDTSKHLLKYKYSLNNVTIDEHYIHMFGHNSNIISNKIIDKLHTFRGDDKILLAVVLAITLFQKENADILHTGTPLFFHLGKLIYSYTAYDTRVSLNGKKHTYRKTLSKNQYLSIGVRFYIKFTMQINALRTLINTPNIYEKAQKQQTDILIAPRVQKTPEEAMREEMQERIEFVKEQQKLNSMITDSMVQKEIANITNHFEQLIEQESK